MTVDDGGQHRLPAGGRSVRDLGGQVNHRAAPDIDPIRRRLRRASLPALALTARALADWALTGRALVGPAGTAA
ncbi:MULTISPECIES: hypothetical protein [Parafrankia]|uniref:hypothetical protein n=1 Tax=Parafrankia TaxID=2994362 RepID=UPI0010422255|nr:MULTISPECIES: hypothetical protein [Parafrankia]MBE3202962.1 hypothetical protein [Parafrankia sp. CH37]